MEQERIRETRMGTCYYCHQQRFVEAVDTETTQEEVNEIATRECDCEEARIARELSNTVAAVKRNIEENMDLRPDLETAVKAMLEPVAAGQAKNCTIKVDDNTVIKIYVNKGRLNCVRTIKENMTINEMGQF